jgi:hypothetical protein
MTFPQNNEIQSSQTSLTRISPSNMANDNSRPQDPTNDHNN